MKAVLCLAILAVLFLTANALPPVITTCDSATTSWASSTSQNATVTYSGLAVDNAPTSTVYSKNPGTFGPGITNVTVTVSNADGTARCSFMVSVVGCTNDLDCSGAAKGVCTPIANTNGGAECVCNSEWKGRDCSLARKDCLPGCDLRGSCDDDVGVCTCDEPYTGDACDQVQCPPFQEGVEPEFPNAKECNDHGVCQRNVGACKCDVDWIGSWCQIQITESGMTRGELAGAIIGGLLMSFGLLGVLTAWMVKTDGFAGFR